MSAPSKRKARAGRVYSFSMLIHDWFRSPEYAELHPRAVKLLIDLYCQYNGHNNGDLCASWSLMAKLGWRSKDTLQKAMKELLERGWLSITRRGDRRKPNLYALSFLKVDECNGKLDVHATVAPLHTWKRPEANV